MSIVERFPDSAPAPKGAARSQIVDACESTWIFDNERRRFRRLLKGDGALFTFATEWRSYDRVLFDRRSDAFIVFLDFAGRRLLRDRRHLEPSCTRCGSPDASSSVASLLIGPEGRAEHRFARYEATEARAGLGEFVSTC